MKVHWMARLLDANPGEIVVERRTVNIAAAMSIQC